MKSQLSKNLTALLKLRSLSRLKSKISSLNCQSISDAELQQILDSRTTERAHYYIKRLIKGLNEIKTSSINDLNLNRWKDYDDIITDSLWILDKRDRAGSHSAEYWGNFVPQIPNQLIRRFTKRNEWVLDPFLGCGTTLIECKRLGRNGVGIELQPSIYKKALSKITVENQVANNKFTIINGDSTHLNFSKELKKRRIKSVQFALVHPPYWDIIKFSKNIRDLSNAKSLEDFLNNFGTVIQNCASVLDNGRYLAFVIGDKYCEREWVPLGFLTMQEVLRHGFRLKSIIVKNFNQTKAKRNQQELWRYRALVGGFYVFKHEYIFLFQKI